MWQPMYKIWESQNLVKLCHAKRKNRPDSHLHSLRSWPVVCTLCHLPDHSILVAPRPGWLLLTGKAMIEVHCSCLAATHTGSEALGRSKDICLTQCAPVHTAHYSVLSAPNAHPETSAASVPACTCPSPAPALPLHSIQPPAICMHAQLNLPSSCKNLAHLACAPRLATWSRLSIPLSRLQQPVLIQTHKMPLSPISSTSTGSRNRKGQEYVLRMGGRVAPVVIKVHCPDPDWNPSFYRPWKALIPPVQSVTVRLGSGGCTGLGQTVRNVQVLCLVLSDWVLQQGRNRQPWPSHQPYGGLQIRRKL